MKAEELGLILEFITDIVQQHHSVITIQHSVLVDTLVEQGILRQQDYDNRLKRFVENGSSYGDLADHILKMMINGSPYSPPKTLSREELREILTVHTLKKSSPTEDSDDKFPRG